MTASEFRNNADRATKFPQLTDRAGNSITLRNTGDPRMDAALFLMEVQENAWMDNGCRKFKGYAQLQRIIEYLTNTD